MITNQIKLIRKYIKLKIVEDNVTFRNHIEEKNHIYDLIKRTVINGESHSALLLGPRGSGKSTLINSVLCQLSKEVDLQDDAIIVKLNGLIHSDEKIALKSITAQMQLENAVGDRVFGTFAENLSFLLSCLQSGADRHCRSIIMVLEECDMFCKSGRTQTLLYNLFDVTHTKMAPLCVIGITNRLDVMELFEKRVKSRFSHRIIYLLSNEMSETTLEKYKTLLYQLLSVPIIGKHHKRTPRKKRRLSSRSLASDDSMEIDTDQYAIPVEILSKTNANFDELDPKFVEDWNAHIRSLTSDDKVIDALEKFCYYTDNEQRFNNVLFQIVSKLTEKKPYIDPDDLTAIIDNTVAPEYRVKLLQSLSILEFSLVIAMKHGMDIFDGQPMNFEMVLHRYTKFANANSSTQTVPRPVILKAFEHLEALEIIMPLRTTDSTHTASDTTTSRVQKEYKLYTLSIPVADINEAVKGFKSLPTEIGHWYNNSVV